MIVIEKNKYTIYELEEGSQNTDIDNNKDFIKNYENALLLLLLDKQLLTQEQFNLCMERRI